MIQTSHRKYWNTWDPESPVNMVFLPADFQLRLGAYSHGAQRYSSFPFTPGTLLGVHHCDGDYAELEVEHAGTALRIEYAKPDPFLLLGRITAQQCGEWGLRFWLLLSGGFPHSGTVQIKDGVLYARYRSYHIVLCTAKPPLASGIYDQPDRAGMDMEEHGYYYPAPAADEGYWGTLKYHLEETPVLHFAVAVANDAELARKKAWEALAGYTDWESLRLAGSRQGPLVAGGVYGECLGAVRDIMAWNTVADRINQRWFTSLTRFWITSKFGGWLSWLNDIFYHALISAWAGDWETAHHNVQAALDGLTPQGNLACMLSEYTEWVDRSQPPIGSFIVWQIYSLSNDRNLLKLSYPALKKAFFWWFAERDGNGNGILEYGTSAVGTGAFVGTKLAAKDESSMDNSPMYDEAQIMADSHTLNLEDIALNSLLVLDGEILARMARELGYPEDAGVFTAKSAELGGKVRDCLWDEKRQIFAGRLWSGEFSKSISPTSFYPLLAGLATPEQTRFLLEHLFNENEFWGTVPLPSVTRNDPAFQDNVYWRGRMWPPLVYLTYYGLKRNRFDREAHELVRRSLDVFMAEWKEKRHCHENFHGETGAGCDSPDSDPFYGWGALLPLLGIVDLMDIDPWNGFHFGLLDQTEAPLRIERLPMGDGLYSLEVAEGVTTLSRNSEAIFCTTARGRLRRFHHDSHYSQVEVPAQEQACWCQFPSAAGNVVKASLNGETVFLDNTGKLNLPAGKVQWIKIWFNSEGDDQ